MITLFRFSFRLVFIALVLLGIVFAAMRLTMQHIHQFQPEIEYLMSGDETRRVVFSQVKGAVRGFNPVLSMRNASINLPDRSQALFIDNLEVEFDFWQSLIQWAPVVLEIDGQLDKLKLRRDGDGRWWMHDLELTSNAREEYTENFSQYLALVPRYLDLHLRRLVVEDEVTGRSHQLDEVGARIDYRTDQLRFELAATLSEELGGNFLLKSSIGSKKGQVYVHTSGLNVRSLVDLLEIDSMGLLEGTLQGDLWINLENRTLTSIKGDLGLQQGLFNLAENQAPLRLEYHSRFDAQHHADSWLLANQVQQLRIEDLEIPEFNTQLLISADDQPPRVWAWFDRIPLEGIPALASFWLPDEIREPLMQSQPQGHLEDGLLHLNMTHPEDFRFKLRVAGLSSQQFDDYPGIGGLDVELAGVRDHLSLKFLGDEARLDFGDQFVAPLELDQLSADVVLQKFDSGYVLAADELRVGNQDIKAWGRLWMRFDEDDRPFMYLRAEFADGQGSSTYKYLPAKLLPEKALAWLNAGIKDGYVSRGDLQYHGRLRDVRELDARRAVEMIVDFDVEGGRVFFDPDWLEARQGSGRVVFHNLSMLVDLDSVSYDTLDGARATAYIDNMDEAEVELAIRAKLPAEQALKIWTGTPVSEEFRNSIARIDSATGQVLAAIDLSLPVGTDGEEQVKVAIDLDDVAARADSWSLDISEANGKLEVNNNQLSSERIKARFYGDTVEIDITPDARTNATLVRARGQVETRNVLKSLPEYWHRDIDGKSIWQVKLKFTGADRPADTPYLQVDAASNLKQTQIPLPQPFAKPRDSTRQVSARLDFFPQHFDFNASFGDGTLFRGRLNNIDDEAFELQFLDIAFATQLKPESEPGLHLYGHIPSISIEDWVNFADTSGQNDPSLLHSLDLSIDQVIAYNRLLDAVTIKLNQAGDRFQGNIDSSLIRGKIELPDRPTTSDPVIFDLEFLRIDKLEDNSDEPRFTPSALADFRFSSDTLIYHELMFNDVAVSGRVDGEALHIDNLTLRRDQVVLDSAGIWEYDVTTGEHHSSVNLSIRGPELGEAISGLGFGDSMTSGTIDLTGGFTWPARIMDVDLQNLIGEAELRIEDGVLNNVEPGSGRFVGLMSLGALPRRLSLDFSDVLVEGMVFDEITGSYQIANGNLYTRNTRLDGPAAKVRIRGRTGIVAEDYDQSIKVTPKITGVLNLGAIAASNWTLLLLQTLFKKAIDDAVEIEYKLHGSWDEPQIDLVKAVDENQRELPEIER